MVELRQALQSRFERDSAGVVRRYDLSVGFEIEGDGIAIRHVEWNVGNKYLNFVAEASRVPVLNMQCDIYHPFQCLADLMTIIEKKGRNLRGKKIGYKRKLITQDAMVCKNCVDKHDHLKEMILGLQFEAYQNGLEKRLTMEAMRKFASGAPVNVPN